mgnify:CR=1 FL=1|tara:strand:- start:2774 stop:4078 length:1305 start_codon:yes stop_codon:yes gene_type:complete
MRVLHKIQIFSLLLAGFFFLATDLLIAQGQQNEMESPDEQFQRVNRAPTVYLDCNFCDYNHIRREISFVNYVRDPESADIHIFITRVAASGGSMAYELSFIGLRTFSEISFELNYFAERNNTASETRDEITSLLQLALSPYISQTPISNQLSLSYNVLELEQGQDLDEIIDPWDFWVFEAYLGSVSLGLESNRTDFDSRWGIFADRVTEEWKLRFRPYFNYTLVEIRGDDRDPIRSSIQRHGIDSYAIKSVNEHWSAGLFATYLTRNDRNTRHRIEINPGVEYSFLPYSEATRRAITLQYRIGYTYVDYFEETIYGAEKENLLNHEIRGSVDILQPWGSISGGIIGSHYFHDAAFRRAVFFGSVSVRIIEGLSLRFSTNFQMIQDQLSLPAGSSTIEDILLRQRELATDYSLNTSIAITYTFGSDFSNIVNTRF